MKAIILIVLASIALGGCGVVDVQSGEACAVSGGCSIVCKTLWNQQKTQGGTTFAGSYYCSAGQAYILFDRNSDYKSVNAGTYSSAQTGLPCNFTVSDPCAVTE